MGANWLGEERASEGGKWAMYVHVCLRGREGGAT